MCDSKAAGQVQGTYSYGVDPWTTRQETHTGVRDQMLGGLPLSGDGLRTGKCDLTYPANNSCYACALQDVSPPATHTPKNLLDTAACWWVRFLGERNGCARHRQQHHRLMF